MNDTLFWDYCHLLYCRPWLSQGHRSRRATTLPQSQGPLPQQTKNVNISLSLLLQIKNHNHEWSSSLKGPQIFVIWALNIILLLDNFIPAVQFQMCPFHYIYISTHKQKCHSQKGKQRSLSRTHTISYGELSASAVFLSFCLWHFCPRRTDIRMMQSNIQIYFLYRTYTSECKILSIPKYRNQHENPPWYYYIYIVCRNQVYYIKLHVTTNRHW